MSFPDGHDRLCAIEWLVQRLAVEHCLRTPDPIVAAEHLKAAGEDYGTLVFTSAVKAGTAEGMTGLDISTALALLVQIFQTTFVPRSGPRSAIWGPAVG